MKAERRHELKENALAKQAVRAVKVMQMPDWRRKYANRAALALAGIILVAALVLHRINSSREDQQRAIDHLARARFEIDQQLRSAEVRATRQPTLDEKFYSQVEGVAEQASTDLEQVGKLVTDPKLLSQAAVLRGDLFYTVANVPMAPAPTTAAASRPAPSLKMSREEYISQASAAYKEVIDKYADQPLAVIAAQFGLGAIDETRGDWDAAAGHYKVILENPSASPAMRDHAKALLANLESFKHPPLLAKAPTEPLVAPTTQKATTQAVATTQPQTQPASTATTTPSATTTAARPQ
jgi:hypothetical protein